MTKPTTRIAMKKNEKDDGVTPIQLNQLGVNIGNPVVTTILAMAVQKKRRTPFTRMRFYDITINQDMVMEGSKDVVCKSDKEHPATAQLILSKNHTIPATNKS
jgi:hypothetical protein